MNIIDLTQGTPEWHAHRAQHFNASDAPAMLGISPYKTRDQLLREKATGITPEIDAATQFRFDEGHRFEALARTSTEQAIGEELFPCVGVLEGTKLSASFDGLTMDGCRVFEHKTLNDVIVKALGIDGKSGDAANLPEHYRVQMEQQLLVSGANYVQFMASTWTTDDDLIAQSFAVYHSDPALRQRIIDGWAQFEKDLAEYQAQPLAAPPPTARAPDALPALHIKATGKVLASNLDTFKANALAVLDNINRDLKTDDDFAHAEIAVKWCKNVEKELETAWQAVLSQTLDIAAVEKVIKEISAHTRAVRLELEKLVKVEKENRKLELIKAAEKDAWDYYHAINDQLSRHDDELGVAVAIPPPVALMPELSTRIKGLKTLDSMRSALSVAVADYKIAADAHDRRIEANIAVAKAALEHRALFPDLQHLIEGKPTDDLRNLITARIAEHEQRERERIEAERERIRAEEIARLERKRVEVEEIARMQVSEAAAHPGQAASVPVANDNGQKISLGNIKQLIAPLSITADGLEALGGFKYESGENNTRMYPEHVLAAMLDAMIRHLQTVKTKYSVARQYQEAA